MDKIEVTQEELDAEQAALQESKEDEIRQSIIAEFGFDETDATDIERIEKAVAKEIANRKNLSKAIGQKVKLRTALQEKEKQVLPVKQEVKDEDIDKKLEEKLDQRLEQRDLDEMDYPDDLKKEIRKAAQIQGISVKAALKDPYIAFKIEGLTKEKEAEEASISSKHKSGGKEVFDPDKPPQVDMSTEEGRKKYDAWFEKARNSS